MTSRARMAMNKTFLVRATLGVMCLVVSANTSAEVRTAQTCSLDHVAAAITAATNGDTVLVPAGTCTWASTLTITKDIVLQGAGIGVTIITGTSASPNPAILFEPDEDARAANAMIRITGFTLDVNNGWTGIMVRNHTSTPSSRVRIDHNRIINVASRPIWVIGTVFGVADNNQVENAYKAMDAGGSDELQWQILDRAYGSAQNFYFEDNTVISNRSGATFHASGNGGRYVARYNSYSGVVSNLSPVFDAHGNQYLRAEGGHHGTMITEFYGNAVDLGSYGAGKYFDHRGGWSLFFYNNIQSTNSTTQLYVREEFDDATFPGGTNYVEKVSNSYYWNNRRNNSVLLSTRIDSDLFQREPDILNDPPALVEGREFWNHNVNYNGTTQIGVFCGVSLPGACTVGDGAWITNQSCSDLSGMIGPSPATPIDGTLYKCTSANTWSPYYRPFPYPHPLRGESGAPSPPQSVVVVRH